MIQMNLRCPTAIFIGPCEILGYDLIFRHYASIRKKKNEKCPAALWLIDEKCEASLDKYEGVAVGFYKKLMINVNYKDQIFKVLTYQMGKGYYAKRKPADTYYEICKKGYIDCGLDVNYLESKRTT
jgi:hypothetical protein